MSSQNNKCKAQEENNMCRKLVVTNEIFLGASVQLTKGRSCRADREADQGCT